MGLVNACIIGQSTHAADGWQPGMVTTSAPWQHVLGMKPGGGHIQIQLADADAQAVDAQVTKPCMGI